MIKPVRPLQPCKDLDYRKILYRPGRLKNTGAGNAGNKILLTRNHDDCPQFCGFANGKRGYCRRVIADA